MISSHIFNLQFHGGKELSSLFTGREVEFNTLSDSLGNPQTTHHKLIVAPWGGGKTHFLLMAFHEAREKPALNSQWTPLFMSGRDSFFSSFSCFLEGVMDSLAHLPEGGGICPEEYRVVKGLFRNPAAQWAQARELLEKFTRQNNKKILLCIDDLDHLLDQLLNDPSAAKLLSSFFSLKESLAVVGAIIPYSLENKKFSSLLSKPFSTLFLAPLKEEGALTVLVKMASAHGNKTLLIQIQKNIPTLKTLFHFTRGNPRLTLVMYQALARGNSISPFGVFLRMLDILSPHYRFLIQNTPPKERKLLDTLLRDGQRVSPSELARRLGWEGKEVSVLLKRLINRGLVKKVRLEPKKSFYGAADPLFCSYYHIQHVDSLKERPKKIIDLLSLVHSCEKGVEGNVGEKSGKAAVPGLFYLEPPPDSLSDPRISEAFKHIKEKKGDMAIQRLQDLLQNHENGQEEKFQLLFLLGFAYSFKGEHQKAADCYKKSLEKKPENLWVLNNMGCDYRFLGCEEKAAECFLRALEIKEDFLPSLANSGETFFQLGRHDEAADCFLFLEKKVQEKSFAGHLKGLMIPLIFNAYFQRIRKMASEGRIEEAERFVEERLEFIRSLPPDSVFPALTHFLLGLVKLETPLLSEKTLEAVKRIFPKETLSLLSPFTLALECIESGKDTVLFTQNEEISDIARLILGEEKAEDS